MNKKAQTLSEGIILFWRFALIFIVILMVILTAGGVFTSKHDIRYAEESIIAEKIISCLNSQKINSQLNFDNCLPGLENYYINLSFKSSESAISFEKIYGASQEVECSVVERGVDVKKNSPVCFKSKYPLILDNNGSNEKAILSLLIGIKNG